MMPTTKLTVPIGIALVALLTALASVSVRANVSTAHTHTTQNAIPGSIHALRQWQAAINLLLTEAGEDEPRYSIYLPLVMSNYRW